MAKITRHTDTRAVGYSKSYWMMGKIEIDKLHSKATVTFYGFRDKAAAQEGAEPIGTRQLIVTEPKFSQLLATHLASENNVMQLLYGEANAQNLFPSATNDL